MGKQNALSITQPGPSRRRYLFTSLATASLEEDGLPLNVGLVIGVDGGREVESVLQDLAGAGVDHGPLDSRVSQNERCDCECDTSQIRSPAIGTYQSRGVARDPGDEDDLASVIGTCES